jgi:hypothetical protein
LPVPDASLLHPYRHRRHLCPAHCVLTESDNKIQYRLTAKRCQPLTEIHKNVAKIRISSPAPLMARLEIVAPPPEPGSQAFADFLSERAQSAGPAMAALAPPRNLPILAGFLAPRSRLGHQLAAHQYRRERATCNVNGGGLFCRPNAGFMVRYIIGTTGQ